MTAAKTSATILGEMKLQRNSSSHTQSHVIVEQIEALDGKERLRRAFQLLLRVATETLPEEAPHGDGATGDLKSNTAPSKDGYDQT